MFIVPNFSDQFHFIFNFVPDKDLSKKKGVIIQTMVLGQAKEEFCAHSRCNTNAEDATCKHYPKMIGHKGI